LRIDNIDRPRRGECHDLIEYVDELHLVFLSRDVADMRRRDDLGELQQRKIRIEHRLVFEHVDGGITGAAGAKRRHQRALLDQRGAAGIDQDGIRLHAGQILGLHDVARGRYQPQMQ
jgi:hypothetical protein